MKITSRWHFILFSLLIIFLSSGVAAAEKKILYHGEHPGWTSPLAMMLAVVQEPDFIEVPLVLSKDDELVVYDDILLQNRTNVTEIFPDRQRQDGNFYVIDFTLAELEQLSYAKEKTKPLITTHLARFKDVKSVINITAKRLDKRVQLVPIIKFPWFHTNAAKDISTMVIQELLAGAESSQESLYIKCYDPEELQRIAKQILPGIPIEIHLIQGIDANTGRETMRLKRGIWHSYSYDWLFTRLGLRVLSGYATSLSLLSQSIPSQEILERLIRDSQSLDMEVFLTTGAQPDQSIFEHLFLKLNVDGVATPDLERARAVIDSLENAQDHQGIDGVMGGQQLKDSTIHSDPEELGRRLNKKE